MPRDEAIGFFICHGTSGINELFRCHVKNSAHCAELRGAAFARCRNDIDHRSTVTNDGHVFSLFNLRDELSQIVFRFCNAHLHELNIASGSYIRK